MKHLWLKGRTLLRLGIINVARVAGYRLGVRVGFNPVRSLHAPVPQGSFFHPPQQAAQHQGALLSLWQQQGALFGRWPVQTGDAAPDWLVNPLTGQRVPHAHRPWWQIPDFDPAVGDIKSIWELSRFDWVLASAMRASQGDGAALNRLNHWLQDWISVNAPYVGPNWKCGQEASIRVMHLAMASIILQQADCPSEPLRDLVRLHLQRIAPTIQYAMGQDNNHGTSEAAALFIGGSWLHVLGDDDAAKWMALGRRWLENRAQHLIGEQGSFSQYSLNYHRVMLDTYAMVEVWRKRWQLPQFSDRLHTRLQVATHWLRCMVNAFNGDGPNVGANDGARLLPLTNTAYRDHRPSIQLAAALFCKQRAFPGDGPWNDGLQWLGVPIPQEVASAPDSFVARDGGFAILRCGQAMAMLRYPEFKFRPAQADALHIDLWVSGQNLLRDAGTFSYNTDPQWMHYFGGVAGHNTAQFDLHDQMPRIGRFLFGDWLKTSEVEPLRQDGEVVRFGAGYAGSHGEKHFRRMELSAQRLHVSDTLAGSFGKALLRWRLAPGHWTLSTENGGVHLSSLDHPGVSMSLMGSTPCARCELVEGWESRHYLEKTALPVLEVEWHGPCHVETWMRWQ